MTSFRAPERLSDDARLALYRAADAIRDAGDLAAAHASVGDVPGLLSELRRAAAGLASATTMLEDLAEAEDRAAARLAA